MSRPAAQGARLDELDGARLPPCVGERVSFMAPFELRRTMTHPYLEVFPDTHGHFAPTTFVQTQHAAACVPFRWMLRETVEGNPKKNEPGLAEQLQLGWIADREPDLKNKWGESVETAWVQERENQLVMLDTFFGALRPEESLCFFYAKRTPLSEQTRRVIVGVGRVLSVGDPTEYAYSVPSRRYGACSGNVTSATRSGPDSWTGFSSLIGRSCASQEEGRVDAEELLAFAPDDQFGSFSFGSEHLSHDGAVASLVACAAALHRIREHVEGPWDKALALDRRPAQPAVGGSGRVPGSRAPRYRPSVTSGASRTGTCWRTRSISERARRRRTTPGCVNAMMANPSSWTHRWRSSCRRTCGPDGNDRREQKALLELISRCAVNEDQARRIYDRTTGERRPASTSTPADFLQEPVRMFERDRRRINPIAFGAIDQASFRTTWFDAGTLCQRPAPRRPVRYAPGTSSCRRLASESVGQGHTLLPRDWVITPREGTLPTAAVPTGRKRPRRE